jgi:hypothetical protein
VKLSYISGTDLPTSRKEARARAKSEDWVSKQLLRPNRCVICSRRTRTSGCLLLPKCSAGAYSHQRLLICISDVGL